MVDDLQSKATEMMKKILTVGVGAVFLTEESLRAMVSEFKLPKELLSAVLDSANKTKSEFLRTLSGEIMSKVMERMDPAALAQEFLTQNEVEFHIKVNIKPKHDTGAKKHK